MIRSIYDITEADEAATSPEVAVRNLAGTYERYLHGDETMAVVHMYELAAFNEGVTVEQVEDLYRSLRQDHHHAQDHINPPRPKND